MRAHRYLHGSVRNEWLARGFRGVGTAVLAVLFAAAPAWAQGTGTVSGRVVNAVTNAPIPSVQVTVDGTTLGTLSRSDGRFLIAGVPAGPRQVRAQLIGFATLTAPAEVRAGESVQLTLQLREQAITLDEVVVTGVGASARRREIGNSLAQLDVEKLTVKPVANIEGMLRGATTGVSGLAVSGQVGGSGTLQLRGVNSVSQGNEPLVYVDGIRLGTSRIPPANLEDGRGPRISGMALNELNMNDIERIEIIKGAAATTLYGTEASGGVIQIFTKRGTNGRPQWSFSTTQGSNFWPELSETIRAHETWLGLKPIQRTGWVQKYDASVRGGTEDTQYYLSANAADEEGIVDTQWSKNWAVTGNFTVQLAENVRVQVNSSYSNRSTRYVPDSNNRHAYLLNAMRLDKGYYPGNLDPSWVLETELLGNVDNFVTGAQVQHLIGPVRNSLRVGFHHVDAVNSGLLPFGYYLYEPGSIGVQRFRNRTVTAEYTGTWETPVTQSIRSTFTWGGQLFNEERHELEARGLDFSGPGRVTVNSAASTFSSETRIKEINAGFFFQETVGLQDRLFLVAGMRVDGSSTFGQDYGLQWYPKLSGSYVLSDYDFWPVWWNTFRLRAAVGEAGKAPGAFDAVRTWNPIAGMEAKPGVTPENLGDPNLGPERTREYEIGFDSNLLDSRIGIEFTYYDATTRDALFNVLPIPSMGFTQSQVQNVGELSSKGIELALNLSLVRSDAVEWTGGVNLTTNDSEVVSMGGAAPISQGYQQFVREGYPAPSFFGRRVTNPDELADPVFESNAYLGRTLPTTTVGLHTSVVVGGSLTLSALGEFSQGGHILNSTGYLNTIRDIWPGCMDVQQRNRTQGVASLTASERARCLAPFRGEDQFVEPGDFFKLRELSVSWRVPQRLLPMGMGSAILAISGNNLLTSTDYTGMDPEVIDSGSSGTDNFRRVDYYNFPPRRSLATKLSVTF